MPGVRRLTEKIGRGVRESQLPSSPCIGGGLDLPTYRRPSTPIERISAFRRLATRAPLSFRRWDLSWIPGIPFGHLPSNRPEAPIVVFEIPGLGTMLHSPAPYLRLEALVEQSCPACYKCPSTPLFSVVLVFFDNIK